MPPPVPPAPPEIDRMVEDACRFIEECKKRHGRRLGWEVGEYLFLNLYRGDEDRLGRNDPGKTDSLHDVSAGCGIPYSTLYGWVRASVVLRKLRSLGMDPALGMKHLEHIAALGDDVLAAAALARWAEATRVKAKDLPAIVAFWRDHLDQGGSLSDLARRFPAPPQPPNPTPPHPRRKRRKPSQDDLLPERLLALALRWVAIASIADRYREPLCATLARIRGLLGPSAAPPRSARSAPAALTPLAAAALPSPFPPGRESREIERAIAFVAARVRAHRMEFSLEVGQYLFESLFRGDLALYHQGGAWRERAIARIAADPRVDLADDVLEACIHTWVLTRFFGRRAEGLPPPDLSPWTWDRMFCLAGDPDALVAVASWAGREHIDQPLVRAAAQAVRPYLEAGGKLEDLLPAPSPTPAETPYRRISRVLSVVESHLAAHPIPRSLAPRAASLVDRMLEALAQGRSAQQRKPIS